MSWGESRTGTALTEGKLRPGGVSQRTRLRSFPGILPENLCNFAGLARIVIARAMQRIVATPCYISATQCQNNPGQLNDDGVHREHLRFVGNPADAGHGASIGIESSGRGNQLCSAELIAPVTLALVYYMDGSWC